MSFNSVLHPRRSSTTVLIATNFKQPPGARHTTCSSYFYDLQNSDYASQNNVELLPDDVIIIHVLRPIIPWPLLVKVPSEITTVSLLSPTVCQLDHCNPITASSFIGCHGETLYLSTLSFGSQVRAGITLRVNICAVYVLCSIKIISYDLALARGGGREQGD